MKPVGIDMLLQARDISKTFRSPHGDPVSALQGVNVSVAEGEAIGIVGESGSGKSTLLRCIMRLSRPDHGVVEYDGMNVFEADRGELRRFRREVQVIFQDPYASLNPRMTVKQLLCEGLIVHDLERSAAKRRVRAIEMLELVGLNASDMKRQPRFFSGGQRQRIAIARALVIRPRILVCDEPVSSLDVSVQAQIISLLQEMQQQLKLTLVFVAHDLAVVRHLCPHVFVLNQGVVVEHGPTEHVFRTPSDSYTQELLAAVPIPDPSISRRRYDRRLDPREAST